MLSSPVWVMVATFCCVLAVSWSSLHSENICPELLISWNLRISTCIVERHTYVDWSPTILTASSIVHCFEGLPDVLSTSSRKVQWNGVKHLCLVHAQKPSIMPFKLIPWCANKKLLHFWASLLVRRPRIFAKSINSRPCWMHVHCHSQVVQSSYFIDAYEFSVKTDQ